MFYGNASSGKRACEIKLIRYQIGENDEAHIYARAKVRVNMCRAAERVVLVIIMKCHWFIGHVL